KPQPHIVLHSPRDWAAYETRLNRALQELESTFDKMPVPPQAHYSLLCPGPQQLLPAKSCKDNGGNASSHRRLQLASLAVGQEQGSRMDASSRLHAMKVCNVLLTRLWRRRCTEVSDLHELIRKYQLKANSMRDDLFLRNNMINREQQRSNRLEMELRRYRQGASKSHNCETIDSALEEARLREAQLRYELQAKTEECNNFSELLLECKTERFRELRKYRECTQELAQQQLQNRLLEMRNAELEDQVSASIAPQQPDDSTTHLSLCQLLTLKDRFQVQNDETAVSVHASQERIDNAYETLKGLEQELFELEIKHEELVRETQTNAILQEIERVQQKMGIVRYLMCFQWLNYRFIPFEIVAKLLDYMLQNSMPRRSMPITSLGLCMAVVILISAFY
ncbi:hypothetical protein KR093_000456, partial [Drosophila rubida]